MQNQQQIEAPEPTKLYAPQTTLTQEQQEKQKKREEREALQWRRSEVARFEATFATASKEAQTYRISRRNTKTAKYTFLSLFGIMALFGVYDLIVGKNGEAFNFLTYTGLLTCFGGATMSKSHKEAAEKLAQFGDVRAVGLLTEALESNDAQLVTAARDALIRLLPRLQFSDANLLSAEQRDILNRALPSAITQEDRNLSLATLKAYEQIGSENEEVAVEKLAASSVAAYDSALRQAAQDCLPYLRASVARRKESASLLRASQAENVRPETLLRPAAYAANSNDAQELLRSSQTEQEPDRTEIRQAV